MRRSGWHGPPQAGTHPGGLLLGIQQGDVEGGRQAGGGEDISQGHAGFSQKPGGREHWGSAGEGVKEPHWGREQLLEIPSSIPRFGGKTATSQFGRCWEDARSLGAGLPALLRQRGDFWGLCALFSTKKKHLESRSGEQGAVSSLDGLSVPAAPRIKMGKEMAWGVQRGGGVQDIKAAPVSFPTTSGGLESPNASPTGTGPPSPPRLLPFPLQTVTEIGPCPPKEERGRC